MKPKYLIFESLLYKHILIPYRFQSDISMCLANKIVEYQDIYKLRIDMMIFNFSKVDFKSTN